MKPGVAKTVLAGAIVVGLGGLLLAVPAAPRASAPIGTPRLADPIVATERSALVRARRQASEARSRSEQLDRRAAAARGDAEKARTQAAAIAARIQSAEARIGAADAELAIARRRLALQQARLAEKQVPVMRLTAALQSLARKPPVAVLARPGSVTDMVHVRSILKAILPEVERRTAALRGELERMRALKNEADIAVAALKSGRENLTEERARLSHLEAERRLTSRRLARGAAVEADRALALGEDARDITQLLDRLDDAAAVRTKLAALPGPIARPADPSRPVAARRDPPPARTAPGSTPAYRLPVVGKIVTGLGEVAVSGVRSRGLTIETISGAQVVAPADGRIAFAGPYRSYGNILIIEHDGGWTSLITDLVGITVEVGNRVRQGEPIGRSGVEDPRITVELRRAGKPIDIVALLG